MFSYKPLADDFFNLLLAFINNNYQDSSFLRNYFYDFCSEDGFYLVNNYSFYQLLDYDKYEYLAYCYNIVDGYDNHMATLEFHFSSGLFEINLSGSSFISFTVPYSIDFSETDNLSISAGNVQIFFSDFSFYPPLYKIVLKRRNRQTNVYETIPYLPVCGFLKVDNNFSLKKFLKTRLFTSDTNFLDDLNSGFSIAAYAEFVDYGYLGFFRIYDYIREDYDITFSYVNAGTFSVQDSSYYRSFCDFDFVEIFGSSDVVVSCVLSSDFEFLDSTVSPESFPYRIDCGFYIDCNDCDELNAYFLLIFKSLNKILQNKDNNEMDYTNVLTQIAQNLSIMSNDVNTNLDNINTNILGIKDNLQYTNTDDITKGLAQIELEKDNSVLVQNNMVESAPFNPHLQKNDLFEG